MVYLNYNNLNVETQQRLFSTSKVDVKQLFGEHLKAFEFSKVFVFILKIDVTKAIYHQIHIIHSQINAFHYNLYLIIVVKIPIF